MVSAYQDLFRQEHQEHPIARTNITAQDLAEARARLDEEEGWMDDDDPNEPLEDDDMSWLDDSDGGLLGGHGSRAEFEACTTCRTEEESDIETHTNYTETLINPRVDGDSHVRTRERC